MKRNALIAIGVAAAGAAAAATGVVRSRRLHVTFEIDRETRMSPEAVIGGIVHVEREPMTMPFVRRVEILDRDEHLVRYKVRGSTLGFPWWIQFRKVWDYDSMTAKWVSERGSYGIRTAGSAKVETGPECNRVHLDVGYSVDTPGTGPMLESIIRPFLSYAFNTWLRRITSAPGVQECQ